MASLVYSAGCAIEGGKRRLDASAKNYKLSARKRIIARFNLSNTKVGRTKLIIDTRSNMKVIPFET